MPIVRHSLIVTLFAATAVSLAAATAPAGDWPTHGASAAHTGFTPGTLTGLRPDLTWGNELPEGVHPGALVVAGGRIFVTRTGGVTCYLAATGAQVWSREIPSPNAPTVDGDLLLVAS